MENPGSSCWTTIGSRVLLLLLGSRVISLLFGRLPTGKSWISIHLRVSSCLTCFWHDETLSFMLDRLLCFYYPWCLGVAVSPVNIIVGVYCSCGVLSRHQTAGTIAICITEERRGGTEKKEEQTDY